MELTFKDITNSDMILIRTQNSEYRFAITDAEGRRGILSGGSLGDAGRDANLVGALPQSGPAVVGDTSKLETGSRALFYLSAKKGIERLITSVVTGIKHRKGRNDVKRAA
ncbi:MAG TPA: hypothetical protein VKA70_13980 [Blastocatellia bacterium]|nr:hypothetical protein [Blastocatellia bacterium]